MRWLVVPWNKARAMYEALGRAYAADQGKVWNEARGGIVEGVNIGKGIHALHKSITTGMVNYHVSADGMQAAFEIRTVSGVSMDNMRGRQVREERIPSISRELSDDWFEEFSGS